MNSEGRKRSLPALDTSAIMGGYFLAESAGICMVVSFIMLVVSGIIIFVESVVILVESIFIFDESIAMPVVSFILSAAMVESLAGAAAGAAPVSGPLLLQPARTQTATSAWRLDALVMRSSVAE